MVCALGTIPKVMVRGLDHPGITKIGQNMEKFPGDLKRLTVTQTTVRNYQQIHMKFSQKKKDYKRKER